MNFHQKGKKNTTNLEDMMWYVYDIQKEKIICVTDSSKGAVGFLFTYVGDAINLKGSFNIETKRQTYSTSNGDLFCIGFIEEDEYEHR